MALPMDIGNFTANELILVCLSKVVAVKRKTSPMTVTFTDIPSTTIDDEPSEILETDVQPLTNLPLEDNEENPIENRYSLNPLWTLSTLILLSAIMALSYRGYLDTLAINYPFHGPKVCLLSNNISNKYEIKIKTLFSL